MSRVDPLIRRYLDDPAGLEEEELDKLVTVLRAHPEKAVALREQLLIDDYLSQKLAIDRQNFFAQIEQRIADFERGQEEMYDHVAELRSIAEADIDRPLRGSPLSWLKFALAAAVCLLIVAGIVAWRFGQPDARQVALVEELSGEVYLLRQGARIEPQLGKAVSTGDQVFSSAGSTIEWHYKDGTRVRVVGDAVAHVRADAASGAKQVLLDSGELAASVAPQQRGPMVFSTPHATATVRGTELRLVVRRADTQLDVSSGSVDFTNLADGRTIQVSKDETGLASRDRIALSLPQWPLDRSRAVFLFDGANKLVLARNPQSGNFRDTPLEPLGNASHTDRGALSLNGGRFASADAGDDITQSLQKTGEFSLELALIPQAVHGGAGGVVLCLGPRENPYLELRQEGAWLILRVASDWDPEPVELRLGELLEGKRTHVIVAGRPGNLAGYLGGSQTAGKSDMPLDAGQWAAGPLSIGGRANGSEAWRGEVVRLAMFAHYIEAEEARRERERFELVHPP